MQADIFIVHRNDGLLRAIAGLLVEQGYRVRAAESIEALERELATAGRPALLLVDDDAAGPDWGERLERIPEDIPRVVLTWEPRGTFPPNVTPVAKPFRARELLDTLSRNIATGSPRTA
jgi:DNA-binding NtrC family response regulator